MWERLFTPVPTIDEPWFPHVAALRMEDTEKALLVQLELPGFVAEEIEVDVTPDYLLVRARHEDQTTKKPDTGGVDELARRVELPCGVKLDEVKACFRKGVLEVTLPKCEEKVPLRRVPVDL